MLKNFLRWTLTTAAIFAGCNAISAELVTEFSGRGAATTREFEVTAPWILDWRVNSEYQRRMKIEIHLVDGVTGFHRGQILKEWQAANGGTAFQSKRPLPPANQHVFRQLAAKDRRTNAG